MLIFIQNYETSFDLAFPSCSINGSDSWLLNTCSSSTDSTRSLNETISWIILSPFISFQWYRMSSKLASNLDCSEISQCIQWTVTTVSVQWKVGFHPVFSFLHVMTMKKTLNVIYSFLREKKINAFLFCIFLFNKYNN